ncbi:MAG TPA: hypothetical protein VFO16_12150 [Pseudonocardiaceae bacterium]|nr:hypothetical protein [Pseudonocardiaceae bacterium]
MRCRALLLRSPAWRFDYAAAPGKADGFAARTMASACDPLRT